MDRICTPNGIMLPMIARVSISEGYMKRDRTSEAWRIVGIKMNMNGHDDARKATCIVAVSGTKQPG